MYDTLIETQAHHQISERIARASAPRLPRTPRRQRLASEMRRWADRLDG